MAISPLIAILFFGFCGCGTFEPSPQESASRLVYRMPANATHLQRDLIGWLENQEFKSLRRGLSADFTDSAGKTYRIGVCVHEHKRMAESLAKGAFVDNGSTRLRGLTCLARFSAVYDGSGKEWSVVVYTIKSKE